MKVFTKLLIIMTVVLTASYAYAVPVPKLRPVVVEKNSDCTSLECVSDEYCARNNLGTTCTSLPMATTAAPTECQKQLTINQR